MNETVGFLVVYLLYCCTHVLSREFNHYFYSSIPSFNKYPLTNGLLLSNIANTSNFTCCDHNKSILIITFINGIYHTKEQCIHISNNLCSIFGVEVYPFYFPSSGNYLNDLANAGYHLVLGNSNESTVMSLVTHLRDALSRLSPRGRILHFAHSGGAIITYLAAKYHLTSQERDKIDVVTFGGGRSITRKYFRGYTVNYYARNDPLGVIDKRASTLLKSLNQNMVYSYNISSDVCTIENIYLQNRSCVLYEVKDSKHNTTFIFLDGLANNFYLDHSMEGPTYRVALEKEAIMLRSRITRLLALETADNNILRYLRKKSSMITGVHHFWRSLHTSLMTPVRNGTTGLLDRAAKDMKSYVRLLRKRVARTTGVRHFWKGRNMREFLKQSRQSFTAPTSWYHDVKQRMCLVSDD